MKLLFQKSPAPQTVLITGALSGPGAAHAHRFAGRGKNLILVDRDFAGLEDLAQRLWAEAGVNVEIEVADLANAPDLHRIEARLRTDQRIGVFVNNDIPNHVSDADVFAASRLADVAAEAFAKRRRGEVINLSTAPAPGIAAQAEAPQRRVIPFGNRPAA